jgi:molybdopterin-biosynthesis enzyme MoeA-like protein
VRGLGPTADDLTAQAAAEAFDQPLTLFPDWLATMAERYASRGRTMARSNTKQAWLPRDCEILDNPVGTACGFVVRHPASHGQSRLFFTPGVPFEFKQMVREQIMPRLKALAGEETDTELRRFYTFGVSESALSDMLDAAPWPAGIELGYRSSMPSSSSSSSATVPAPPTWTPPRRGCLRPSPLAGGAWQRGACQPDPGPAGERSLHLQEGRAGAPCWPCVTGTRP